MGHVIKSFMVWKNKFVPELDDENWLTDLAFLVDLSAHLNELNMHFQGENQLISTMFQTITLFQMKLKLWLTVLCISLTKHWLNTVLWAVKNTQPCFSIWYKNLKTDFKISGKIIFCYICDSLFSRHKYVTCQFSNGMHRAAIWHST